MGTMPLRALSLSTSSLPAFSCARTKVEFSLFIVIQESGRGLLYLSMQISPKSIGPPDLAVGALLSGAGEDTGGAGPVEGAASVGGGVVSLLLKEVGIETTLSIITVQYFST